MLTLIHYNTIGNTYYTLFLINAFTHRYHNHVEWSVLAKSLKTVWISWHQFLFCEDTKSRDLCETSFIPNLLKGKLIIIIIYLILSIFLTSISIILLRLILRILKLRNITRNTASCRLVSSIFMFIIITFVLKGLTISKVTTISIISGTITITIKVISIAVSSITRSICIVSICSSDIRLSIGRLSS